jgi:hypothetical protein
VVGELAAVGLLVVTGVVDWQLRQISPSDESSAAETRSIIIGWPEIALASCYSYGGGIRRIAMRL